MKVLKYILGQRVWVKGTLFLGALLFQKWTQRAADDEGSEGGQAAVPRCLRL